MEEEKVGLSTLSWLMLERAEDTEDVLTLRRPLLGMSLGPLLCPWDSSTLRRRMVGASFPHCIRSRSPSIFAAEDGVAARSSQDRQTRGFVW